MNPTIEQIEAVAEWWAVRTFDKVFNQNNGDDSENGGMAFMLMNMAATSARSRTSPDARPKFKAELVKALTENPNAYFDVDYHPSEPLAIACQNSGTDPGMMPCKTFTTWDRSACVFKGRYQYGGQWETIGETVKA